MGTMPTANVACIFSQHDYVRVVLWGLLFPVPQHSLEHCADNFIFAGSVAAGTCKASWGICVRLSVAHRCAQP